MHSVVCVCVLAVVWILIGCIALRFQVMFERWQPEPLYRWTEHDPTDRMLFVFFYGPWFLCGIWPVRLLGFWFHLLLPGTKQPLRQWFAGG